MTTNHQTLIKQMTIEAQPLPEHLVREVLDFIGYLRLKYEGDTLLNPQTEALLATFGTWEDDHQVEEIVDDIYRIRTISNLEPNL